MIWSQSIARQTLLGEESQNPSIAARSLFARVFGQKRLARGIASTRRFRRPFRRDNPVPALLAGALPMLGGLGKRFQSRKSRDAARKANTDAQAAAVLAAPLGSPSQALALERMQKQGYATSVANRYHQQVLAETVAQLETMTLAQTRATAAERRAAAAAERREAAAAGERREERITQAGLGIGQALLGRARRPTRRRRTTRRRSTSYRDF